MKKSQLKKIIREELKFVLTEDTEFEKQWKADYDTKYPRGIPFDEFIHNTLKSVGQKYTPVIETLVIALMRNSTDYDLDQIRREMIDEFNLKSDGSTI